MKTAWILFQLLRSGFGNKKHQVLSLIHFLICTDSSKYCFYFDLLQHSVMFHNDCRCNGMVSRWYTDILQMGVVRKKLKKHVKSVYCNWSFRRTLSFSYTDWRGGVFFFFFFTQMDPLDESENENSKTQEQHWHQVKQSLDIVINISLLSAPRALELYLSSTFSLKKGRVGLVWQRMARDE